MFRRSVIKYNISKYKTTSDLINPVMQNENEHWICKQCDTDLKKNRMPHLSLANNLQLDIIPEQLKDLSSLEMQLVSKVLPFMKIVALHRGAQTAIKGQIVLVPSDISKVTTNLPRPTPSSQIITLALKRRLSDKHSYHQEYIRPSYVNAAIQYLKKYSKCYSDVTVNNEWEKYSSENNLEFWTAAVESANEVNSVQEENSEQIVDSEDEVDNDNPPEVVEYLQQKSSINSTTCVASMHGPNVSAKNIVNLAPAEGQRPTSCYDEPNWEAMAFPRLFPTGQNTYNTERLVPTSPKQYFISRLLHKDGRFAETPEYIFQSLDILERQSLQNSISITTRKSYQESLSAGQLKDPDKLVRLLSEDQVFASFKTIRGTPQYWQQMQLDMLAKLRQLGPYTFFITGSAAEFHWPEVIQVVASQYGVKLSDEEIETMDWNTKRMWLKRNPVTAARQIDYIFDQLWKNVILSGAHPVGQVLNFDRRKEMQGRGTEHFHSEVHVKDAPKLDIDSDNACIAFINRYISCNIPDKSEDNELHNLVISRQIHHHTRTCKKNKTKDCRFGYPRMPSPVTVIARPPDGEDATSVKRTALAIQTKANNVLKTIDPNNPITLQDVLKEAQITEEQYTSSVQTAQKRVTVLMKRSVSEMTVNNYNSHILRALRSNMDIQFITNMWACIAYLTSYICKPERTMSELMRKASKEANGKSVRNALKDIGQIFLKSREVSEHEAVAGILSLPLRRSNTDVEFIQTDIPENRTRILKPKKISATLENDDQDIYERNIHDKYAKRPDTLENVRLAEFVADYSFQSMKFNENDTEEIDKCIATPNKFFILKDNFGKVYKRSFPRVIRYHFISKQRDEELYYHRLLILYLPWRSETELSLNNSFTLKFHQVKNIISMNINRFEPFCEAVEHSLENFNPDEACDEIWNEMSAEAQREQLENEESDPVIQNPLLNTDNPEYNSDSESQSSSSQPVKTFQLSSVHLSSDDTFLQMVRSLNDQQRQIFDFIFTWATESKLSSTSGKTRDPFYIFLSGGGGVGKTFTINTIFEGLVRALRLPGQDPEKPTVLMTASTGKAASNINGTTLHSAFALPVKNKGERSVYKKPSIERLNTLRSKYINLKVIIADEISMFGGSSLDNLNSVLQDIFQDKREFAGKSILAVGDLMQLNHVGDRAIFKTNTSGYEALAGSLWAKSFSLYQLTTIVRQKGDPVFADLLSRVRLGKTTESDIQLLKNLEHTNTDTFPPDTVHIYKTNKQVNEYNEQKLALLPQPHIIVKAQDSKKDLHTNTTSVEIKSDNIYETGGLPSSLIIAKGARWMITKNIDISDHLVNGVIGTIEHIDIPPDHPMKGVIYFKFDSPHIGSKAKQSSPKHLRHAVPIKPVTVRFILSKYCSVPVERCMFPGVLAYALTIHKAQGSTYPHMIADFTSPQKSYVTPQGLAYTMLSRATCRSGIKLINFQEQDIKINQSAFNELNRMASESKFNPSTPIQLLGDDKFSIGHLNIRSLSKHIQDVQADSFVQKLSVLCLSETHISRPLDKYQIDGYVFLPKSSKHGLAIYIKTGLSYHVIPTEIELQILAISVSYQTQDILILVLYKPPTDPIKQFLDRLSDKISTFESLYSNVILLGDFNMSPQNRDLEVFTTKHHLTQKIDIPTHILGGTLDFILTNMATEGTFVSPVPYSDHFLIATTVPMHI